jgi:hypothetical protein
VKLYQTEGLQSTSIDAVTSYDVYVANNLTGRLNHNDPNEEQPSAVYFTCEFPSSKYMTEKQSEGEVRLCRK